MVAFFNEHECELVLSRWESIIFSLVVSRRLRCPEFLESCSICLRLLSLLRELFLILVTTLEASESGGLQGVESKADLSDVSTKPGVWVKRELLLFFICLCRALIWVASLLWSSTSLLMLVFQRQMHMMFTVSTVFKAVITSTMCI